MVAGGGFEPPSILSQPSFLPVGHHWGTTRSCQILMGVHLSVD